MSKLDQLSPWSWESWGEEDLNGPKVETDDTFTDAMRSAGFTAERLPYPRLNRILHDHDDYLNAVMDGRISFLGGGQREKSYLENRFDVFIPFLTPYCSAYNRVSIGTSTSKHIRVYPTKIASEKYTYGERKILVADYSLTEQIRIINADLSNSTSVQSLSGLPAGDYHPISVIADGTYAYVAWEKESTYEQYVQSYKMEDWTVRTGWPSTGLLVGQGSGFLRPGQLVFANDTYLAWAQNYNPGTTPLSLINRSTGVVASTGKGDIGTSAGTDQVFSLCSNGVFLFYVADGKIASASIANLSAGCGGTGWPITYTDGYHVGCAGNMVFASVAEACTTVTFATTSNATYGSIDLSALITGTMAMAFDGRNLWVRAWRTIGTTDRQCLIKVPYHALMPEDSTTAGELVIDSESYVYPFNTENLVHPVYIATESLHTNLIADDRDLWMGGHVATTATNFNPAVFRLPFSRWR